MELRRFFQISLRTPHKLHLCLAVLLLLTAQLTPGQDKKVTPTPTPAIEPDDAPLRVQTDLVTMTLTVHDKWGRYVSNLTKKHFAVFENDVEQEITFFSDVDSPASIGIIYDVSGSMNSGKIARSRRALERFMLTSHPSDEYSLIAFNDKVRLLADRTRDGKAVLDKLMLMNTGGNTALNDAVYLGVDRVMRGAHKKRALVIISDGQDNNSRFSYAELRRYLKEADVIIYSVGIIDGSDGSLALAGEGVLKQLSELTGGKAFFPHQDGAFNELFERIALELRHQYSIGYVPKDFQPDGKWRRLKAKVTPPRGMPNLSVRGREGYYATPVALDK